VRTMRGSGLARLALVALGQVEMLQRGQPRR
jgi:hypothetical protein